MNVDLYERELTEKIIGAAIEVHKYWGPGLYEEVYEKSLCKELTLRGFQFERQVQLPLIYKDESVGEDLRLDVLVERKVVVENKHVKQLLPIHEAQVMTYLRLTNCRIGLLFNYNSTILTKAFKRIVI